MGTCMSSKNHRSLENINLPPAKPKDIITFKQDKISALADLELNKDEVEICKDVHG